MLSSIGYAGPVSDSTSAQNLSASDDTASSFDSRSSVSLSIRQSLGSYYIPGLVENEKQGLFVDFVREIEQRAALNFDVHLKPTRRTQKDFKDGHVIGYFPELYDSLPLPKDQLLVSEPFWVKTIHVFTLKQGGFVVDSLPQLEGRKIALVRGYTYGRDVKNNPKIQKVYVDNDFQSLKMLQAGRVDAVLGDLESTVSALHELKLDKKVHYTVNSPLYALDVFFVFQKTEQGRALNHRVSKAIQEMKQEGYIAQKAHEWAKRSALAAQE